MPSRFALAAVVALTLQGCALMASGLVKHNSRGTACVETPVFAAIDLLIAAASVADGSTGGYVSAGVFGASGVIGGISAIACDDDSDGSDDDARQLSNTAPSFGEAPVDPSAREATREEIGITPIAPAPDVKLKLDRDYDVDKHKPPASEKRSCRDAPDSCAPGETCAIAGAEAGFCVPAVP